MSVRILHSYPNKIGAGRICTIAWHQAADVAHAGGEVLLITGVVHRPLPANVTVQTTLSRGRFRIPYKALGHERALALHDRIVARQLPKLLGHIDVVHVWPLAAAETLRTAKRLGIPTLLERPNAHTRFAYQVVDAECARLGVALPQGHEHAYSETILRKEEEEYALADWLLCPSEFVAKTFRDEGYPEHRLLRHGYGFDHTRFFPSSEPRSGDGGLSALFAGGCAVRKGLHFALEAWLRSPASETGTFRIAGDFVPAYREKLAPMLAHPSVQVLGHRDDVPQLMRDSDILFLPTIEEGSPLVCAEAIGSGCVPLVSSVCTDNCIHNENALIHPVGDVDQLSRDISLVASHPERLRELRDGCLRTAAGFTWRAAGQRLLDVYAYAADTGQRRVEQEVA